MPQTSLGTTTIFTPDTLCSLPRLAPVHTRRCVRGTCDLAARTVSPRRDEPMAGSNCHLQRVFFEKQRIFEVTGVKKN